MNYSFLPGNKIIETFANKISVIRAGRVTVSILDNILVDAYGSKMQINELATITAPDANQLLITPFDKGLVKDIEKAILTSNLGVNPGSDGAGLRLVFPPMTQEARQLKVKELAKLLEEIKIVVRNHRQDELKKIKHQKENSEISEDIEQKLEKDLQKEVDALNKELESMFAKKEAELLKV